jgi:hypothetical protein
LQLAGFHLAQQLIGKKMDLYANEEEEVLLLLERVTEAQRFATMVCFVCTGRGGARWFGVGDVVMLTVCVCVRCCTGNEGDGQWEARAGRRRQ